MNKAFLLLLLACNLPKMSEDPNTPKPTASATNEEEDSGPVCESLDKAAASEAFKAISVRNCFSTGGPSGGSNVKVTIEPNGSVSKTVVDQPPFAGTAAGTCVEKAYANVKVPAFCGAAVTVTKSFYLSSGDPLSK